jgi:hypothetical protein
MSSAWNSVLHRTMALSLRTSGRTTCRSRTRRPARARGRPPWPRPSIAGSCPRRTSPDATLQSTVRSCVHFPSLLGVFHDTEPALQFTTNNGYVYETGAHWISSYFLRDAFLRLPPSAEDARAHTRMTAAWLRRRYPRMLAWANESYSSGIAFWKCVRPACSRSHRLIDGATAGRSSRTI